LDTVRPNASLACTLSTQMMRLGKNCRWSQLTILLVSHRALCRHESHREGSAGGALSHVRREAGRKVRTQHWHATNRTASRAPLSGLGEVNRAETVQATTDDKARRSKATFTSAAAAAISSAVGVEIWSSPCRPRFGGSTNEFWCCIAISRICARPSDLYPFSKPMPAL
jgi:hypothetical protein